MKSAVTDPDTGTQYGWAPAPLRDGEPALCRACRRNLVRAFTEIPALHVRLSFEQLPTLTAQSDGDIVSTSKVHPPILLNGAVDALQRLLEHETDTWAWFVAEHAGMIAAGEWDQRVRELIRPLDRLHAACTLLALRADELLLLPAVDYEPRSLGFDPAADLALHLDHYGDLWAHRDGIDAAVLFLELHRRAREITGLQAVMRSPLPCPNPECRRVGTVFRDFTSLAWVCRRCGDHRSDATHTAYGRALS